MSKVFQARNVLRFGTFTKGRSSRPSPGLASTAGLPAWRPTQTVLGNTYCWCLRHSSRARCCICSRLCCRAPSPGSRRSAPPSHTQPNRALCVLRRPKHYSADGGLEGPSAAELHVLSVQVGSA